MKMTYSIVGFGAMNPKSRMIKRSQEIYPALPLLKGIDNSGFENLGVLRHNGFYIRPLSGVQISSEKSHKDMVIFGSGLCDKVMNIGCDQQIIQNLFPYSDYDIDTHKHFWFGMHNLSEFVNISKQYQERFNQFANRSYGKDPKGDEWRNSAVIFLAFRNLRSYINDYLENIPKNISLLGLNAGDTFGSEKLGSLVGRQ